MYLFNDVISFQFSCFQVKILNSADNKTNYTVTVITENVACDRKEILIYGEQIIPDNWVGSYFNDRLHFMGTKKIIRRDSSSINNGQNECVFRHICEDICHYVFISVLKVPGDVSWKICEVYFN